MGKQVGARFYGGVAQLGEHLPCKQGVKGSKRDECGERSMYLENFILNDTI